MAKLIDSDAAAEQVLRGVLLCDSSSELIRAITLVLESEDAQIPAAAREKLEQLSERAMGDVEFYLKGMEAIYGR